MFAHVEEQEAAGAMRNFGRAERKVVLADECGTLVAEAARSMIF